MLMKILKKDVKRMKKTKKGIKNTMKQIYQVEVFRGIAQKVRRIDKN